MGMWQTVDNKLYKKFKFNDFAEALAFINRVGSLADEANHHPTITNTYNNVELWLSTHDAGDVVTNKDKDLAAQIDSVLEVDDVLSVPMSFKRLKMYADGGSRGNPGPSASGYVLMDTSDNIVKKSGVYVGITTNNQAEYQSLKFGLEEARRLGAEEIDVFMDSLLVVNQMKGIFKVKNQALLPHYEDIKLLAGQFKRISFTHVPRELNKLADAEVNTTLDAETGKT
jgi:ribonuclease HI